MPSEALKSLLAGIEEVRDLQKANPTPPGGLPDRPRIVRAINRASVVLLSSHLERYLRGVNEKAVGVVNASTIDSSGLSERLKLQHSKIPIDELAESQWDNRGQMLSQFVATDAWLWNSSPKADLDHERLLRWLRSPSPDRALRLFKLWGVPDIFSAITRKRHTRNRMWLKLEEGDVLDLLGIWEEVHPLRCRISTGLGAVPAQSGRHLHDQETTRVRADA